MIWKMADVKIFNLIRQTGEQLQLKCRYGYEMHLFIWRRLPNIHDCHNLYRIIASVSRKLWWILLKIHLESGSRRLKAALPPPCTAIAFDFRPFSWRRLTLHNARGVINMHHCLFLTRQGFMFVYQTRSRKLCTQKLRIVTRRLNQSSSKTYGKIELPPDQEWLS